MLFEDKSYVKKLLLFLLICCKSTLFSQTMLNSIPLELKKKNKSNQIFSAENPQTHDVFVLAMDDENVSVFKYNSFLFLTDEFKTPLKDSQPRSFIGYSFSDDGNITLYWSRSNFAFITATKYYLENKNTKTLNYRFPTNNQYIITTFQQNDSFYILSKEIKSQLLVLDTFKNGLVTESTFDFSTFRFQNKNTQFITFTELLKQYPIEKMDPESYNPLYKSTAKSKLYLLPNQMILTFDHIPGKTQTFDVNMQNQEIKEKSFNQTLMSKGNKTTNSFYLEDKLYQITANEEEVLLDIKGYTDKNIVKSINVSKNDTIRFKISPLLIQRENRKSSSTLKTTKKFLKHLSLLDGGLSVYRNNDNIYMTLGGTPKRAQLRGVSEAIDERNLSMDPLNGQIYSMPNYYFSESTSFDSVYFECVSDTKYNFKNQEEMEPLAIDNIYYFLSLNKTVTMDNTLKFKDFYILGYYDFKSKQYIMRKFKDGFSEEETFDTQNIPSNYRKPFSLNKS